MSKSTFISWSERRFPLDDEGGELARIERYWLWLSSGDVISENPEAVLTSSAYKIVAIKTPEEADYEAYHLRHSTGFNWLKYSTIGDIYSVRNDMNIPIATILVKDGKIIHAREKNNVAISINIYETILHTAKELNWDVAKLEDL